VLEVSGKTGVDARDFVQQHIVEIDLGREQSRRRTRTIQPVQPNMCSPDRAQGIANGAINGLVGMIDNFSHFQPSLTQQRHTTLLIRNATSVLGSNVAVIFAFGDVDDWRVRRAAHFLPETTMVRQDRTQAISAS
jgi:hypothetical protein